MKIINIFAAEIVIVIIQFLLFTSIISLAIVYLLFIIRSLIITLISICIYAIL